MSEIQHYKVRIDSTLIRRFEQMAEKYGRKSGNQIAAEVLERFTDFWETAEQARQAIFEQQRLGLETSYSLSHGKPAAERRGSDARVMDKARARETRKKKL